MPRSTGIVASLVTSAIFAVTHGGCSRERDETAASAGAQHPHAEQQGTSGDTDSTEYQRRAYRPVLEGNPLNTSPCVVLDLSQIPPDAEFDEGLTLPREGYLIVEDSPLGARWSRERPSELPAEVPLGIWWGRSIVRFEPFVDELLDDASTELNPHMSDLLDRIGERVPDNGDKIGGWPFFSLIDEGSWLQLSAGSLGTDPGPTPERIPVRTTLGEFASFGAGWVEIGQPEPDGSVHVAAESHW